MASGTVAVVRVAPRASRGLWGDAWRRLLRNRPALLGFVFIGVFVGTAVFAPLLPPPDPRAPDPPPPPTAARPLPPIPLAPRVVGATRARPLAFIAAPGLVLLGPGPPEPRTPEWGSML